MRGRHLSRYTRRPASFRLLGGAGTFGYDATNGVISGSKGEAMTFARALAATYTDPRTGVVVGVGSGKPRVIPGYGVLIEQQSINQCLQSANWASGTWSKDTSLSTAPVVTADQTTAPDGTLTADQLAFGSTSTASSLSLTSQQFTGTAAGYTFSVWLRAATPMTVYIQWTTSTVWTSVACAVTTTWQRFQVTATLTAATWFCSIGVDRRDATQSAQPAQTCFAWGAQVERRNFATSYIPTTTAAVTRPLDSLTFTPPTNWPVASGDIAFRFAPIWNAHPDNSIANVGFLHAMNSTNGVLFRAIAISGAMAHRTGNASSQTEDTSAAQTWVALQSYLLRFTWGNGGARQAFKDNVSTISTTGNNMPTVVPTVVTVGGTTGGGAECDGWISDLIVRAP